MKLKWLILPLAILSLVACGGGGGGGGSADNSTTPIAGGSGGSGSSGSGDSSGSGSGGTGGTTTSDLVSDSTSTLQDALDNVTGISTGQATTIAEAAAAQIEADGHSDSDNASEVLPSMLSGTMTGIGELGLTDADLINSLVEQSITTIMGLLGDDAGTARLLRSAGRSFEETQSLLEILVNTAVAGLEKTKLPKASLGAGVGKVVSAVVSNLDKAKVPSDNVSAAMSSVVTKSMEGLENFPADVDLGDSVDQITSNAISGAGNLASRDANINLSESVGTAVSSVVKNLDKAKVESADVAAKVESVVSKSMESLENFAATDLTDTVDQITQSAIAGTKELKKTKTDIDLGESVGKVVSSVVKNLKKAKVNSADVSASVERVVSKSMESLEDGGLTAEEVNASVQKITDGAVQGAGDLAKDDETIKASLGTVISTVAKSTTENLANLVSEEQLEAVKAAIQSTLDNSTKVVVVLVYVEAEREAQTTALQEKANEGATQGSASLDARCESPFNDNRKIPGGKSVTAYEAESVAFGETCQEEERLCTDGVLDGTYTFKNCKVRKPEACEFAGKPIQHGQSVNAYFKEIVAFGQECQVVERECNNGTLGGNVSYNFDSCQVEAAKSCSLNGVEYAHGEEVTFYKAALVPNGQTCESQTVTCENGVLGNTFTELECKVEEPVVEASCELDGKTVASGKTIEAFLTKTVPSGSTCESTTLSCSDGTLSGEEGYDFATCTEEEPVVEASCELDGQTVASGETIIAYLASQAETCESEERSCTNGALSGSFEFGNCTTISTGTPQGVFCSAPGDASCQAADVARFGQVKFGK